MTTLKLARAASAPTGFEPGASVGSTTPAIAATPLDSAAGVDHFAAVEARRIELLDENHARQTALRERANELHRQAEKLHLEANEKARANSGIHAVADMRARVNELLKDEERIRNVELRQLEAERVAIASGQHPTMAALRIAAQGRIDADNAARLDQIARNHASALSAFDEHLARIATSETLALAQALADATKVARLTPDNTVRALLAARSKAVA
jgi:hypothetical protein